MRKKRKTFSQDKKFYRILYIFNYKKKKKMQNIFKNNKKNFKTKKLINLKKVIQVFRKKKLIKLSTKVEGMKKQMKKEEINIL